MSIARLALSALAIEVGVFESSAKDHLTPQKRLLKSAPRTLLCNELEKGKEYLLVVTTP